MCKRRAAGRPRQPRRHKGCSLVKFALDVGHGFAKGEVGVRVWLGTTGYSYSDWVGPFYPRGTKAAQMLGYYGGHLPMVELNFSFYRVPTAATLTRLAEQTPPAFQFVAKIPRSLSHEQDDRQLAPFRAAVEALAGLGQLLGTLCQLPQSNHNKPANRIFGPTPLLLLSRTFGFVQYRKTAATPVPVGMFPPGSTTTVPFRRSTSSARSSSRSSAVAEPLPDCGRPDAGSSLPAMWRSASPSSRSKRCRVSDRIRP